MFGFIDHFLFLVWLLKYLFTQYSYIHLHGIVGDLTIKYAIKLKKQRSTNIWHASCIGSWGRSIYAAATEMNVKLRWTLYIYLMKAQRRTPQAATNPSGSNEPLRRQQILNYNLTKTCKRNLCYNRIGSRVTTQPTSLSM